MGERLRVAGAMSMAVGEYVSVSCQRDLQVAELVIALAAMAITYVIGLLVGAQL